MSLNSSNSMRTCHFLRAPDIDPLHDDDDYVSWEYDPDQDDSNLSRFVTGCERPMHVYTPTVRDVRQVRKASEAAERAERMFSVLDWDRRTAFQDGRDFYDAEGGSLLASYPNAVKNDYDTDGALAALRQFQREWGEFYLLER